jgi:hypothetical protein
MLSKAGFKAIFSGQAMSLADFVCIAGYVLQSIV